MASTATAGFELRDHTADIALHVWASSFESLLSTAADGLYATIGELSCRSASREISFHFRANDAESIAHDFLADLLYRFEVDGERVGEFVFHQADDRCASGVATAWRVDPSASIFDREIKAVTYHDLRIVEDNGRFEVTFVLDV